MRNKVTLKSNHTKKYRSLQEDQGLLFLYMKMHVYKQHISIFEVYLLVNATTSELRLLFADLRALRTTVVRWEGGIYASTYFRIRIWLGNLDDHTSSLHKLYLFSLLCAPPTQANSLPVIYFLSN